MNWKIISCSQAASFVGTPLGRSLKKWRQLKGWKTIDEAGRLFANNQNGLPKMYNQGVMKLSEQSSAPIDAFVFVHDDVELSDILMEEKLNEAFRSFDVVGLAGSEAFFPSSPAIWNKGDKSKWSGAVAHSKNNMTWMTQFGVVPKRCTVMDGLFLACKSSVFNKIMFDETFTFHFYDLDFCIQAVKNKIPIGTCPIWVTHHSIGDWTSSNVWKEDEPKFIRKWNS